MEKNRSESSSAIAASSTTTATGALGAAMEGGNGSSKGTKWPSVSAEPVQQYVSEGECCGGNGGGDGSGDATAAHKDAAAWLATIQGNNYNNNNNDNSCASHTSKHKESADKKCIAGAQLDADKAKRVARWNCASCEAVGGSAGGVDSSDYKHFVETLVADEDGGKIALDPPATTSVVDTQNTSPAATALATPADIAAGVLDVGGAGSLSPPPGSTSHSNRTSVNNSTENLSYSSDNYDPDDLILLNDVADVATGDMDAEALSLNSDDCVYAYRGDGADFDGILNAAAGRGVGVGASGVVDDETDFLEMDFEPDPLSEIEYGAVEAATPPPHADAFLLQRDSCHLSGRHTALIHSSGGGSTAGAHAQRQHFSSPIDELLPLAPPPSKALQAQSLLSKNFALITMHLDQIKIDAERAADGEGLRPGMASDMGSSAPEALSLPASFAHATAPAAQTASPIPAKVTGAKPKRYTTTIASSSSSSKSSSKSRNPLRAAAFVPATSLIAANGSSCNYDERNVGCSEFRAVSLSSADIDVGAEDMVTLVAGNSVVWPADDDETVGVTCNDNDCSSGNDETCLDCLEREFLANTIGKVHVPNKDCTKCRKKRRSGAACWRSTTSVGIGGSVGQAGTLLYGDDYRKVRPTSEQWPKVAVTVKKRLCDVASKPRRTSPRRDMGSFLRDVNAAEAENIRAAREEQDIIDMLNAVSDDDDSETDGAAGEAKAIAALTSVGCAINQRTKATKTCDNYSDGMLELVLNIPEVVRIPSVDLSEEALVQALDSLHASYNPERLRTHFKESHSPLARSDVSLAPREFLNLKHFFLFESKKNCNHPKLKQMIELVTRHQVHVHFEENADSDDEPVVYVKVTEILQQWARHKDLIVLRQLDRRFMEANVLGKVANIVRQTEHQRRPLPECIAIPQYYPSGCLVLTKKKP